ncbi:tRNA pseudouridine(55) synthase TruB [Hydrotalea flava]|uniref:tRNA pseudouridine(55) synthase TruB n=1 Tax=Hydrotalea flava TaxID=714549 RepID=UPI000B08C9EF|nr:tRNA pseudouridine(55) synthase TruB [Hydrotalea flava]
MKQKSVIPALQPFLDGKMLLLNKPLHWTSFDVVKKVRITTGISKVGHAGTLDPLATGLLIVCTGAFTKKINDFMGMDKVYTGSITLGATTASYDLETTPQSVASTDHITEPMLEQATKLFTGAILQMPPQHSAIKKDGKPLYLSARKGIEVEVAARPVTIHSFEITNVAMPVVHFKVHCSTGTYIRSLANDFGAALGVGGYLSSLCRTAIGNFELKDASTIEAFEQSVQVLKTDTNG